MQLCCLLEYIERAKSNQNKVPSINKHFFEKNKASVGHFKGRAVATGHETVAEHFNLPGHSVADMRIMGIERVMSSNPNVRKIREKIWIYRYDSVTYGGNTRDY